MTVKEICHDIGVQDIVQEHRKLSEVYTCLPPDVYLDDEMQRFKKDLAANLANLKLQISDQIKEVLRGGLI
jgi:hypothetical protein